MTSPVRTAPPPASRFQILHRPLPEGAPLLLQRASSPERATTYFHDELARLTHEQAYGELLVVRLTDPPRTVLRQPLR